MTGAVEDFLADSADNDPDETYRLSPALNYSTVKALLLESPRHALEKRMRAMGPHTPDPDHSRDREIGTMTHKLLLGSTRGFRKLDAWEDYRTKDAQQARAQCELAGITPILGCDLERASAAANRLREQLWEVFQLELNGQSEVPLYWSEGGRSLGLGSDSDLPCKAKLDHICKDGVTVLDIKSGDANPRQVTRRIMDQALHVQAAAYLRSLVANVPSVAGHVRFIDLFIETSGLTMLTPVAITGSMLELGERQWIKGCRRWWQCEQESVWPGYTTEVLAPEAPKWALEQEMVDD